MMAGWDGTISARHLFLQKVDMKEGAFVLIYSVPMCISSILLDTRDTTFYTWNLTLKYKSKSISVNQTLVLEGKAVLKKRYF